MTLPTARIIKPPPGIPVPRYRIHDDNYPMCYEAACRLYIKRLRAWFKKLYPGTVYVGKIIGFPVADSKALYMVITVRPPRLVHLPIHDGWEYQYAKRLTQRDVLRKIKENEFLEKTLKKGKC